MSRKEEELIQTETVRVRIKELPPGGTTPFHRHSEITDNIFGLTGDVEIQLRGPDETIKLSPGSRCKIPPDRSHMVTNLSLNQEATYLLVQGIGHYDFLLDE